MMRFASSLAAVAVAAQLQDINGGVSVDALKLTTHGKPDTQQVVYMTGVLPGSIPRGDRQNAARHHRSHDKRTGQGRKTSVLKDGRHTPVEGYYNPKGTWCVKLSEEEVRLREELGLPAHASATAAQKEDAESKWIKWGADGWYGMDEETSYLLPVTSSLPKVVSNGFNYNLTHWKFRNLPGVKNGTKLYIKRTTKDGRDERLVRKL